MENSIQLATRFREVILDGKWIAGTNFKAQLTDLTWQQATTKVGALNTIALLTFHINYYIEGILNVFEGGDLEIRDKFSFDMPPISSQKEWEMLRETLCNNAEKFAEYVETMSMEDLEREFVKAEYGTYRRNIEGVIEHSYYHFGQVSLLKKLIIVSQEV